MCRSVRVNPLVILVFIAGLGAACFRLITCEQRLHTWDSQIRGQEAALQKREAEVVGFVDWFNRCAWVLFPVMMVGVLGCVRILFDLACIARNHVMSRRRGEAPKPTRPASAGAEPRRVREFDILFSSVRIEDALTGAKISVPTPGGTYVDTWRRMCVDLLLSASEQRIKYMAIANQRQAFYSTWGMASTTDTYPFHLVVDSAHDAHMMAINAHKYYCQPTLVGQSPIQWHRMPKLVRLVRQLASASGCRVVLRVQATDVCKAETYLARLHSLVYDNRAVVQPVLRVAVGLARLLDHPQLVLENGLNFDSHTDTPHPLVYLDDWRDHSAVEVGKHLASYGVDVKEPPSERKKPLAKKPQTKGAHKKSSSGKQSNKQSGKRRGKFIVQQVAQPDLAKIETKSGSSELLAGRTADPSASVVPSSSSSFMPSIPMLAPAALAAPQSAPQSASQSASQSAPTPLSAAVARPEESMAATSA